MSPGIKVELVCDTLKMSIFRIGQSKGVIVHSDRGSQYCSGDFSSLLQNYELQQSISRKGNYWNNVCAESFFHSLKVEAILGEPTMDRKTMSQAVFEYIEVDYNKVRRHSANCYLSPETFELKGMA